MTVQIAIRLPDELSRTLDQIVAAEGPDASRTSVVRDAIEQYLLAKRRALVDAEIVEGYRRQPPGGTDDWGDLEAQTLVHALAQAAALDQDDGGWE